MYAIRSYYDPVIGQHIISSGYSFVYFKGVTIVTIQPVHGTEPHQSAVITENTQNGVLRKSVPCIQMFKAFNICRKNEPER